MSVEPPTRGASVAPTTVVLLERERVDAERLINGVRAVVLLMLGGAAAMYAPQLTPGLRLVNMGVLGPMLLWTIGQYVFVHRPKRVVPWLTTANAAIDLSAVTALLFGYGLVGAPQLALTSPIWVTYFVILAARPFTSSAIRAAIASAIAVVQYAIVVSVFVVLGHLSLRTNPLATATTGAGSVIDEIAKLLLLAAGGAIATYATAWNERTLRRAQSALHASESELRALVGAMSDVIVVLDHEARYVKIASSGSGSRHRPPTEWLGRCLHDVLPSEQATTLRQCVQRALATHQPVEVEYSIDVEGDAIWFIGTVSPMTADSVVWVARDITARKALEAQLAYQAMHDPLTGLANRALFHDRVARAFAAAERASGRIAVLFLDVDEFKTVNDSLGHGRGDQLLAAFASRLLNATRGCDTVARLGGDEFAVLLENANADSDAIIVAERIAASLGVPFAFSDGQISVTASIGIARATDEDNVETLLRNADVAMYRAKHEGKGRHAIFELEMHQTLVDRIALENDLREGIERGELRLVYQPIVELSQGRLVAVESLVRWAHPQRGMLPPGLFIPVAEETGLIVPLGRFVLREACRQAAAWQNAVADAPVVTVNLSALQFQQDDLSADVASALEESNLDPTHLVLEITESVVMQDIETTVQQLRTLKALGVQLAVDDFGTGYSSLSSLQRFPLDILKIDKSFIDGVTHGGNDAALARTIIALGEMLHMRTVAEGIEHPEQRQMVRSLGCHLGQGYLFAKPMPAGEITRLIDAPQKGHRNSLQTASL